MEGVPSMTGLRIALITAILTLAGCATPTYRLVHLDVGMSEAEVLDAVGPPDAVRNGGLRTGAERPIEIWEYHMYDRSLDKGLSALFGSGRSNVNYWLYFEEGVLYRWGPAGEGKPPVSVKK